MAKRGKRYQELVKDFNRETFYEPAEALAIVKEKANAKFDETVEVAVRLGVDPRHADQQVRGTVVLPHGTGRQVRVLVFAKGEKAKEAEAAGADFVGAEDLAEKIQGGWTDFDVAVATPDMMGVVGRLGRILGPRGLMPNPKTGTVTMEIEKAVREIKAGKVEYRVDKAAIVHVNWQSILFSGTTAGQLPDPDGRDCESKAPAAKGTYLRKIVLSQPWDLAYGLILTQSLIRK